MSGTSAGAYFFEGALKLFHLFDNVFGGFAAATGCSHTVRLSASSKNEPVGNRFKLCRECRFCGRATALPRAAGQSRQQKA